MNKSLKQFAVSGAEQPSSKARYIYLPVYFFSVDYERFRERFRCIVRLAWDSCCRRWWPETGRRWRVRWRYRRSSGTIRTCRWCCWDRRWGQPSLQPSTRPTNRSSTDLCDVTTASVHLSKSSISGKTGKTFWLAAAIAGHAIKFARWQQWYTGRELLRCVWHQLSKLYCFYTARRVL